MNGNNIIDVQKLEITPQDADNTYLGIDADGQLIRTKIELSSGGGEAFANIIERNCYLTSVSWYFDENGQPNEEEIEIIEITEEQRAYNIETYEMAYGDNVPLLTHSGGFFEMSSGQWNPSEGTGEVSFSRVIGDSMLLNRIAVMSIKINHNGDADGRVKLYDFYSKKEVDDLISNIEIPEGGNGDLSNYYTKEEVNGIADTKQNTIEDLDTIRSGAAAGATALQSIPSEYITETELETRLENVGGGDGGSTVVELTGSKPTLDEFNILYESAAAGKPTFVKYDEGVFNIIADNNSVTNRGLYHFYADAFTVYIVFWYKQTNKDTIYDNKSEFVKTNDGIKNKLKSSKDDIKLYSADEYSNLPRYFEDYSSTISAPISTYYGKSGTFLLDGKMYYFDVVNGEKDGIYVKPKVVDLLNISGGDVDLSEYYTKTEINGLIGDINNILETI